MVDKLQRLNDQYGIADHLQFKAGPGQLTVADIRNDQATATVALQGGHVISFQPHGQRPVLWVSQHSHYQAGRHPVQSLSVRSARQSRPLLSTRRRDQDRSERS